MEPKFLAQPDVSGLMSKLTSRYPNQCIIYGVIINTPFRKIGLQQPAFITFVMPLSAHKASLSLRGVLGEP
jgi:hypothetical protein